MKQLLVLFLSMFLGCIAFQKEAAAQWVPVNFVSNVGVFGLAFADSAFFAVTDNGFDCSLDNGESWRIIHNSDFFKVITIGRYVITATFYNTVFYTINNGANWQESDSGLAMLKNCAQGSIYSLNVIGTSIFMSTDTGTFRSIDSGMSWQWIGNFSGPFVGNSNSLYALGNDTTYLSSDNGEHWIARSGDFFPDTGDFTSTSIPSFLIVGNILYIGTEMFGDDGGVYCSSDSGSSWQNITNGLPIGSSNSLNLFILASKGDTLYACNTYASNFLYYSTNRGLNWIPTKDSINMNIGGGTINFITSNNATIYVGTTNGIFSSTDNGDSWLPENRGLDTYPSLFPYAVTGNNLYASLGNNNAFSLGEPIGGCAYRSTDNGNSWTGITCGAAPEYSLIQDNGKLYFENIFSGNIEIAISSDYGADWETLSDSSWKMPGNWGEYYSIDEIGLIGSNIFVIGPKLSLGYFVFTSDTGMAWVPDSNIPPPPYAINGNYGFAAQNDSIFKSTNNGINWMIDSLSLHYKNISSIVSCNNNLFVATDSGVYRSSDNGTSWNFANSGLGNAIVNSFTTYDSIVFTGTDSNGVYLSTNNGDYWNKFSEGMYDPTVNTLAICGNNIFAGTNTAIFRRPLADTATVAVRETPGVIPSSLIFGQNYPNPFNAATTINYSLPKDGFVSLKVYNALGEEIASLVNCESTAGEHTVLFNVEGLQKGVYFCRGMLGAQAFTQKLVMMR